MKVRVTEVLDEQSVNTAIIQMQEFLGKYTDAKIRVEENDYSECYHMELYGYREETETEKQKREREKEYIMRLKEEQEKKQYEILKRKYGV